MATISSVQCLIEAADRGDTTMTATLIASGCNVSAMNFQALRLSACNTHMGVFRLLMDKIVTDRTQLPLNVINAVRGELSASGLIHVLIRAAQSDHESDILDSTRDSSTLPACLIWPLVVVLALTAGVVVQCCT